MKKAYISPTTKVHNFRTSNIICYSVNGEADPNKAVLSKEATFYFDDDNDNE